MLELLLELSGAQGQTGSRRAARLRLRKRHSLPQRVNVIVATLLGLEAVRLTQRIDRAACLDAIEVRLDGARIPPLVHVRLTEEVVCEREQAIALDRLRELFGGAIEFLAGHEFLSGAVMPDRFTMALVVGDLL